MGRMRLQCSLPAMKVLPWFAALLPLVAYGLHVGGGQPLDGELPEGWEGPPPEGWEGPPPEDMPLKGEGPPPKEAPGAGTNASEAYPTGVSDAFKLACPEEEYSRYLTIVCSSGLQNCGSEWCQEYK